MSIYFFICVILGVALLVLMLPVWRHSNAAESDRRRFIACVCAVFLVAGVGLYSWLGAPRIIPLIKERDEKLTDLTSRMSRYSDSVTKNPKDIASWVGLGQGFMETGQFKAAANSFKEGVILSKGDPRLILAYATALIYEADGKVTDDAKKSLEMVLVQDKENAQARYFLNVRLLQDGKTEEAMKAMKELYRSLPEGSPVKAMINQQIGKE